MGRTPVTRVLLYEPSYQRIRPELPSGVEVVVVGADGGLQLDGRPVAAEQARAEAGWFSPDLFLGGAQTYIGALMQAPDLRWVQSASAGLDNPVFARLAAQGVRLSRSSAQGIPMAEYVISTVLDHYQRGPERRRLRAAHEWKQPMFRELGGTTWLMVGFGNIGQAVAERARGFGLKIIGVRRTAGSHELADLMITPEAIASHLGEADVVVVSTPLNAHTRGLVDQAFLAAMKPQSVLVNVGRGGLVDEAALLAALDRGVPDHAILDVFQTEPLPADSPFWDHPKVAMTCHASAFCYTVAERGDRLFLDNLSRYVAGRPLLNETDPADILAQ